MSVSIPTKTNLESLGFKKKNLFTLAWFKSFVKLANTNETSAAANTAIFAGTSAASGAIKNSANAGASPVGTCVATEYGDGYNHVTVLTLTDFIIGANAGAGAALSYGNICYEFPAGTHFKLVSNFNAIVLTAVGTAVNSDTGLGSVVGSGANATLQAVGATSEDVLTGQTIATAAAGGAAASALLAATAGIGAGIALNVAGSEKSLFLNSAGTWNADNTGNLTASGTIVLVWTTLI